MESSSASRSLREISLVVTVVCCAILSSSSTTKTTAMPMKEMIEAAMTKSEGLLAHSRQKRAVNRTSCTRPSDTDLNAWFQQMNSQLQIDVQFLQPAINEEAISIPAGEEWTVNREDENDATTCPHNITRNPFAPLAHRSLCPYFFNILILPQGYYPTALKTAQCKCQFCVEHNSLGCEPVPIDIAVLKPVGCFKGMQKYEEEKIQLYSGCTCAFPSGTIAPTGPPTPGTTTPATTASWGVE